MSTRKVLIGLAVVASAMACSAAPAMVEWSSPGETTEGIATSGAVTIEGGGATLECTGAEGKWKLPGSEGTKLTSSVEKWIGCKGKSSQFKGVSFSLGECSFKLESAAENGLVIGSVAEKACVATAKILSLLCEIKLPASKANEGLKKGLAVNEEVGETVEAVVTAEYGGITDEVGKACFGITGSSAVKFKTKTTEANALLAVGRFAKTSLKYPVLESSAAAAQTLCLKTTSMKQWKLLNVRLPNTNPGSLGKERFS